MAFSLRFEDNAERRQRLRLAQQSRKRRARDTDASPHHLEPSDHQFASVSAMAASANAFVPDAWSLIALLDPEVLQGVRHPRSHNQPIVLAFLAVVPWNPKKYCRCVSLDISIGYSSAVATAGTAWNGTRLWL